MQTAAPNLRPHARNDKPSTDAKAKERSSWIANRLGVHSTAPVIDGVESLETWIAHRDTVVGELNPVGKLETAYAERAALYLWRLDRVVRYEITATEFDLEDLIEEFIHSLDHPDLPRDRSETVTLEKIRAPLGEYLKEFAKWGDIAAKLPGRQEELADIREKIKRIKERRILPDQPTIQTIVKYEAHLNACLARTMTELRRLQKERRQGLREVEHVENTRATASEATSSGCEAAEAACRTCICQNKEHENHSLCRNDDLPCQSDSPSEIDSTTQIDPPIDLEATTRIDSPIGIESPSGMDSTSEIDSPIPNPPYQPVPESKKPLISESTPQGIVVRERNASGVMITMFPQTQYSANPKVIVPQPPVPIQRR